jgi:3-isopropylmalate dehydrogenase
VRDSTSLRYSFRQSGNAECVEAAVRKVLADGYRTADIFQAGSKRLGTSEMGEAVVESVMQKGID